MPQSISDAIRQAVKERYGNLARKASEGMEGSCCGAAPSCSEAHSLYSPEILGGLPGAVVAASAGCGNPTAISGLRPGETVLDLGSGGGIDCFLARQKVGPEGRIIGVDMTQDMVGLARKNAAALGYDNVEFRLGQIEEMPLANESVDVIISNCVINLSTDKDAVFREAFRVLRPRGRICVSDIMLEKPLPSEIRQSLERWVGCIAGALVKADYLDKVKRAGFSPVQIIEQKDYSASVDGGEQVLSVTFQALKP